MTSTVPRMRRPRAAGEGREEDPGGHIRCRDLNLKFHVSVYVTSRSSIYLSTASTDQPEQNPPLYENAPLGPQETPQRPRRRKKRTDDPSDVNDEQRPAPVNPPPQTVCRSVSFLRKKSYQECLNSAIEKQLETVGIAAEEARKSTTNGVEWECQDLSLYLGSLLSSKLIQRKHSPLIVVANF